MNIKQTIIGLLGALIVLLGGGYAATNLGSTGAVRSTVATSSFQSYTAGATGKSVATSTLCAARIISTQGSEIKLTFNDVVPTSLNGHTQIASTTVIYDSEVYGCGAIRVFPYGSQTITVTETR